MTVSLSEQTDIIDLLGSDLPVEGNIEQDNAKGVTTTIGFKWYDGVLLEAMKKGNIKNFFNLKLCHLF